MVWYNSEKEKKKIENYPKTKRLSENKRDVGIRCWTNHQTFKMPAQHQAQATQPQFSLIVGPSFHTLSFQILTP